MWNPSPKAHMIIKTSMTVHNIIQPYLFERYEATVREAMPDDTANRLPMAYIEEGDCCRDRFSSRRGHRTARK